LGSAFCGPVDAEKSACPYFSELGTPPIPRGSAAARRKISPSYISSTLRQPKK
jgi:hypothetical protein